MQCLMPSKSLEARNRETFKAERAIFGEKNGNCLKTPPSVRRETTYFNVWAILSQAGCKDYS